MERAFKLFARDGVFEHMPPNPAAIQRTIRCERVAPEQIDDRAVACFPLGRHGMSPLVGIGDVDSEVGERPGDFRLATADSACQADDVTHVQGRYNLESAGPKKSANAPAMARYGPNASGTL